MRPSYADEAYKELVKSNKTGKSLKLIITNFRRKTYFIVITMIYSLPDGSIIKINSIIKLEDGLRNSKLLLKEVIPKWSIET